MPRVAATNRVAVARRRKLGIDLGKCCSFNSSTSKISFTVPTSFNPANLAQFTCAAWIFMSSYGGSSNGRVCDFASGSGKGWSWLINNTNGHVVTISHTSVGAVTASGVNAARALLNTWQRVLITWDDANNIPLLYINGLAAPVETSTNKSGSRVAFSGDTVKIGNRFSADDRALGGLMDEFCVWNRVLTASEITDDFCKAEVPTSGLILRFLMNEASGNLTDTVAAIVGTPSNVAQNVSSFTNNRTAL